MDSRVISTLEKKYNCPVWICQDGSLVPMVLMTDRHLAAAWKHQTARLATVNRIVSDEARDTIMTMVVRWIEERMRIPNQRIPSQAEQVRDVLLESTRMLRAEAQRRGKPELTPNY